MMHPATPSPPPPSANVTMNARPLRKIHNKLINILGTTKTMLKNIQTIKNNYTLILLFTKTK